MGRDLLYLAFHGFLDTNDIEKPGLSPSLPSSGMPNVKGPFYSRYREVPDSVFAFRKYIIQYNLGTFLYRGLRTTTIILSSFLKKQNYSERAECFIDV